MFPPCSDERERESKKKNEVSTDDDDINNNYSVIAYHQSVAIAFFSSAFSANDSVKPSASHRRPPGTGSN